MPRKGFKKIKNLTLCEFYRFVEKALILRQRKPEDMLHISIEKYLKKYGDLMVENEKN